MAKRMSDIQRLAMFLVVYTAVTALMLYFWRG